MRWLIVLALFSAACSSPPVHLELDPDCESLVPEVCALPFPSNYYAVADSTTVTGLRVAYPPGMAPPTFNETPFRPDPWNRLDGFSGGPHILAAFTRPIDTADMAEHSSIDRSLEAGSPSLLLDAETGEAVAHFVENDVRALPGEAVGFYLRPTRRLADGRRYVVALRGLRHGDGTTVEPSPAFRALRDETPTDSEQLEGRRPAMEEVFGILEDAGVDRAELTLAWDFTVASHQSLRGDLLFMIDDALTRVGPGGLGCTVESVEEPGTDIYRRIDGTFTVPSYMSTPNALSNLVRDSDGRPAFQELVEVGFVAMIPASLAAPGAAPGRLVTYGHGQLGSDEEVVWSGGRSQGNDLDAVLIATQWAGMSEDDLAAVTRALADVSFFDAMAERLHQGMVNMAVLARTMAGVCASDAAFDVAGTPAYDPAEHYFIGISQGSILGGTFMALTPDIERANLSVGAGSYSYIVERSANFREFEDRLEEWYELRIDQRVVTGLMQQLWDHTDSASWAERLGEKKILYTVGKNDTQVPNIASDWLARTAGFPLVDPPLHPVWGLTTQTPPFDGSAYVYYDMGDPAVPDGNEPPSWQGEVHGELRKLPSHAAQLDAFFAPDGRIVHTCDGPCNPD